MPLGETIGTAYVRVLADGTGFSDDVKRQMREHDGTFTRLGHEHGRAYQQGFAEESSKHIGHDMDDLRRIIQRGAGRFNATGEFIGSELMDGIRDELEKRFGEVGTTIFRNLREELTSGQIDFSGLVKKLQDIRPEMARATRDIAQEQARQFDELAASVDRWANSLIKSSGQRRNLIRDLTNLVPRMDRAVTGSAEFRNRLDELKAKLRGSHGALEGFASLMGKVGDATGRAFGRGSRNDFLNFFGGLMSIIPRATAALAEFVNNGVSLAKRALGELQQAVADAGGGIRGWGEVIGGLAKQGIPGLIAAAAAVAATVSTLVAMMGVAASAVSLLSGAILALAGSLGFALVGALAAVGGAIVPVAAALGVFALALIKMDKKSKPFKDLKKTWEDLQKTAQRGLFGKNLENLTALTNGMKAFKPIIESVATAMGHVLKAFGEASKSKGFKTLMEDIGKALGPMVETLGRIAGNLGLFLGRAFLAAEPFINQFLGWLEKVTKAMADAGKPGKNGKSPLSEFFSDAVESAKIVWGLISSILDLLGELFSLGKGSGDNIITGITGEVEKLTTWIRQHPDTVKQWFKDAETFAGKLGKAVEAVGGFIADLDTPTNRAILMFIVDAFTKAVTWLGDMSLKLDEVNQKLGTFAQGWKEAGTEIDNLPTGQRIAEGGPIEGLQLLWDKTEGLRKKIGEMFKDQRGLKDLPFFQNLGGPGSALDLLRQKLDTLRQKIEQFPGLGEILSTAFTTAWTAIETSWNEFWASFNPKQAITDFVNSIDLSGSINALFDSIDVSGAIDAIKQPFIDLYNYLVGNSLIPDLVDAIVRTFATLPRRIVGALGNLGATFATWVSTLPGKARTVASQVVSAFSGLAGRIISRAGSIAAAFGSWFASLPGKARTIANQIASAFSGLARKAIDRAGSLSSAISSWASGVYGRARSVAEDIARAFRDVLTGILSRISLGSLNIPAAARKLIPGLASGGIVLGPSIRQVGESGPEAVVPLNRPLSMVDPAVRQLSAIAQGKTNVEVTGRGGKTIDVGGITVITPTEDPFAVASEVVARMAAAAYI